MKYVSIVGSFSLIGSLKLSSGCTGNIHWSSVFLATIKAIIIVFVGRDKRADISSARLQVNEIPSVIWKSNNLVNSGSVFISKPWNFTRFPFRTATLSGGRLANTHIFLFISRYFFNVFFGEFPGQA